MNKKKLIKRFLKENPMDEISAAKLTHFRMVKQVRPDWLEILYDAVDLKLSEVHEEALRAEKNKIKDMTEAEDMVNYMRKISYFDNVPILLDKALKLQEVTAPLVLKRIRTSGQDMFIENAAIFLANADDKYTDELYSIFDDIRSLYAKSVCSIVFGVKQKEDCAGLLLRLFEHMIKEALDEHFEQGPLLALNLLYSDAY